VDPARHVVVALVAEHTDDLGRERLVEQAEDRLEVAAVAGGDRTPLGVAAVAGGARTLLDVLAGGGADRFQVAVEFVRHGGSLLGSKGLCREPSTGIDRAFPAVQTRSVGPPRRDPPMRRFRTLPPLALLLFALLALAGTARAQSPISPARYFAPDGY